MEWSADDRVSVATAEEPTGPDSSTRRPGMQRQRSVARRSELVQRIYMVRKSVLCPTDSRIPEFCIVSPEFRKDVVVIVDCEGSFPYRASGTLRVRICCRVTGGRPEDFRQKPEFHPEPDDSVSNDRPLRSHLGQGPADRRIPRARAWRCPGRTDRIPARDRTA